MNRRHFRWAASTTLPTKHGEFLTHVFTDTTDDGPKKEHVALVYGDVAGGLRAFGVQVEARIPHVVAPNDFSRGYLEAKRLRMAHELPSLVLPLAGAGGTL